MSVLDSEGIYYLIFAFKNMLAKLIGNSFVYSGWNAGFCMYLA